MKKGAFLFFILVLVWRTGFSQETPKNNNSYNMFSCKDCNNKFFIASNSGIRNTPIGLRLGFLCKTGAYIATRFGKSEEYHMYNDNDTVKTTLFSITLGLIKPVYVQNNFSIHAFLGGGYGQLFPNRREYWTKDGYEVEAGLMTSYKRIMFNVSANMFDGYKMYATWDFTLGIGYRF